MKRKKKKAPWQPSEAQRQQVLMLGGNPDAFVGNPGGLDAFVAGQTPVYQQQVAGLQARLAEFGIPSEGKSVSELNELIGVAEQERTRIETQTPVTLFQLRQDPAFAGFSPELQQELARAVTMGGAQAGVNALTKRAAAGEVPDSPMLRDYLTRAQLAAQNEGKSYEEAFFNTVTQQYIAPDMGRDAQRRADADRLIQDYGPAFAASRQLVNDITQVDPATGGSMLYGQELAQNNVARDAQLSNLGEQLALNTDSLAGELSARAANQDAQFQANLASLDTELAAKRGAIETELSTLGQAVTQQDVDRRAALETQLGELNAAQDRVDGVRVDGARSLGTAINLGAQSEMDRTRAQMAQAGYVGGSSSTDMALGRSLIQARQGAAQAVADANLTNAVDRQGITRYGADTRFGIADRTAGLNFDLTGYGAMENRNLTDYGATQNRGLVDRNAGETRQLGDYGASQGRQLIDFGAGEQRGIKDSAAQRQLGYFSADVQRRLASLSLPAQAVQQELQVKNMADEYGQSGLKRAQDNLGFFNIGTSQAPNAQAPAYQANTTMGSAFQNLGGALVGAAGSFANANNWWQPKPAADTTPKT
jgi:hypothetical protein